MRIITIGRNTDNNVIISDPSVGRFHAKIILHNDGHFTITDLDSKNGTFVNGKRIYGEYRLNPNDEVRVGTTTLSWRNYFTSSVRYSRKKPFSGILPILVMFICVALLTIVLLVKNHSNEVSTNNVAYERPQPTMRPSATYNRSRSVVGKRNISQDVIGQTLTAPSEDGYFPKDWRWKLEPEEVLEVQELYSSKDPSGNDVVTILAHLRRGEVRIDAKMVLKYTQTGLVSSRVTELIIPRQTDYSQYVKLEMNYDFLPSLVLYNHSNMTLFVGGDYSAGGDETLFSAVVEPHSSEMIAVGNVQSYHIHFAYEK